MPKRPIALTIAGSDSSGGAGLQADLKTFGALGVYGASVVTALTAQNTRGVSAVHAVPPDFVVAQIDAVMDDLDVHAAKTGMLANREIVTKVAAAMAARPSVKLVVDPVMVATSGDLLLEPDAVASILTELLPVAALVTPNLAEAARLTSRPQATDLDEMAEQGAAILASGCGAVLIKGGHADGPQATDVLVAPGGKVRTFTAPRIDTLNSHGTGCTLSAAIAARLAHGDQLEQAIEAAKHYLTCALEAGRDLGVGRGHGPVDHLVGSAPFTFAGAGRTRCN